MYKSQIIFIPGKLITDNIIVAYELFHSLKRWTQGNQCFMALKRICARLTTGLNGRIYS